MGVLSSWVIVAGNKLFALVAASATSFADSSSAWRSAIPALKLPSSSDARDRNDHIFDDDPTGVLKEPPLGVERDAIYGSWREDAAQNMISEGNQGSRNQESPIAIKRDECKRDEHEKVSFDSPATYMDHQGRHWELGHRHDPSCRGRPRKDEAKNGRWNSDDSAQHDRQIDVWVN